MSRSICRHNTHRGAYRITDETGAPLPASPAIEIELGALSGTPPDQAFLRFAGAVVPMTRRAEDTTVWDFTFPTSALTAVPLSGQVLERVLVPGDPRVTTLTAVPYLATDDPG